jgi:drug/metabolite transporter (DMT)-like permease
MFCLGYFAGDYEGIQDKLTGLSMNAMLVLLFSCLVGTFIGYTSWLCRGMVSAATFSLVGVINKFITVLLNVFIWDKHSSPAGLLAVCICLLAGSFYQQSPKRSDIRKSELERDSNLYDDPKLSSETLLNKK